MSSEDKSPIKTTIAKTARMEPYRAGQSVAAKTSPPFLEISDTNSPQHEDKVTQGSFFTHGTRLAGSHRRGAVRRLPHASAPVSIPGHLPLAPSSGQGANFQRWEDPSPGQPPARDPSRGVRGRVGTRAAQGGARRVQNVFQVPGAGALGATRGSGICARSPGSATAKEARNTFIMSRFRRLGAQDQSACRADSFLRLILRICPICSKPLRSQKHGRSLVISWK
ncbi:uncharacterized protein [Oryctolagus cuniculus]|uniref:uncharacterized protein n=1 Tax=Oryctolagus cuniculus TaxID=9986 RepID=UPI00387985B0